MAEYDNENKGALFANDKKTSDKQPGYKGKATVDGVEYWVSCWVNKAGPGAKSPGQKYLSLAFTPVDPENTPTRKPQQPSKQSPMDDFDDDIPF